MARYDALRERALANFELLLTYWDIEYIQVSPKEYDMISPFREDENHGAFRFNIDKGTGADFAGTTFENSDFLRLGPNFTHEDFAGITKTGNWGFDIIGLCQRLKGAKSYSDAARLLRLDLKKIRKAPHYKVAAKDAAEQRQHRRQAENLKRLTTANRIWSYGQPYKGSIADSYFQSRNIHIGDEPNIKFHHAVYNAELKTNIPCVLFRVQKEPDGPLVALHRIYIAKDGTRKARLQNPKKALASVAGAGIWFGKPNKELYIVEGPENALVVLSAGADFVVSTINATNFASLTIPVYVEEVILVPDTDEAGETAAIKATIAYRKQKKKVTEVEL